MKQAVKTSSEREKLYKYFSDKFEVTFEFSRKEVSFQANKKEPVYRWFKYKEGFSSQLVKHFLTKYSSKPGKLLDPFAGIGTTTFAGQELGWDSYGIEVLPIGAFVMKTRQAINETNPQKLQANINQFWTDVNKLENYETFIKHIPITKDAYPDETEVLLNKYLTNCSKLKDNNLQSILKFAALSILEEISFTRKDGQYLRWDFRSKRNLRGKPFNKGEIVTFPKAIQNKFEQIIQDLTHSQPKLFNNFEPKKKDATHLAKVIEGSALDRLPEIEDAFFDFIITSPPYCNRYDYTRTYALELVFLGKDNDDVRNLRQDLLSCTVENKEKIEFLKNIYTSSNKKNVFEEVITTYQNSKAMTEVNTILENLNELNKLNNKNIARMVRNYFLELCFTIYELARITKKDGYCVMVNDNVRYGGEEIPVDLILSEFAEKFGFRINKIFVLPKGKGNSSQQMGKYGREEIRKCIYLWQKL